MIAFYAITAVKGQSVPELVQQGWLTSRAGQGTRVVDRLPVLVKGETNWAFIDLEHRVPTRIPDEIATTGLIGLYDTRESTLQTCLPRHFKESFLSGFRNDLKISMIASVGIPAP